VKFVRHPLEGKELGDLDDALLRLFVDRHQLAQVVVPANLFEDVGQRCQGVLEELPAFERKLAADQVQGLDAVGPFVD